MTLRAPHSQHVTVSLHVSLANANQYKALVTSERYHVVTTTNIRVDRLARQREGGYGNRNREGRVDTHRKMRMRLHCEEEPANANRIEARQGGEYAVIRKCK
jgi:hypothetical protein